MEKGDTRNSKHCPGLPRVSLARVLSKLGFSSRSRAQVLIRAGRVAVNDVVQRNPARRVDMEHDRIAVDGKRLTAMRRVYLMLNKPRGLVTSAADERGRDTVYRCLTDPDLPLVFPVGRLDKASEGLLLFTNDTRWAARILDPAKHLDKVYHVQVDCLVDELMRRRIRDGIEDRGEWLRAKRVRELRHGSRNSWVEIVLDEGKNRQIRRMFQGLGANVLRIVRIAVGPLELGELGKGAFRYLTPAEQEALGAA